MVATAASAPGAPGQAGTLDPTFSGNGKVAFKFAPRGAAGIRDIAVQSDGKLVAVGRRGGNFAVLRFMPDGSLDTTFGGDGKVTTWFPNAIFGFAQAVAIQADGKILAAGTMSGRHDGGRFAFARYLPNGHLDPTFGGGDGKVRQQFSRHFDACNAVAIQTDGKIVAAGESSRHTFGSSFAVMRLNVNGKLDKSFNADGRRLIDFSDENLLDRASGVVLQPDGRIVLGGSAGDPLLFGHFFALARLNVDGSLDASFGSGGKVVSDPPAADSDPQALALALGSDGKLVLAGWQSSTERSVLARFDSDGVLDASFGGDGVVTTRFPHEFSSLAWDVEIQPDGRVVAAGEAGASFGVARYNVDGTLDSSFSGDGRVTTSFNRNWGGQTAFAMALQPDGKIVAAGDADARPPRLLLVRYLGN
jgi:uncharacterized delta-60 repeat protein